MEQGRCKVRNTLAQKKVEEVRKPGSPPEPGQAQHFDFRLFILTTMKEYTAVGLSPQVCGNLLWKPCESNTDGEKNDARGPYKVRGTDYRQGGRGGDHAREVRLKRTMRKCMLPHYR